MKKIFYILLAALCLNACAQFTEIQPKGKNILSSTAEIDMLLNFDYSPYQNFGFQCSSYYGLLVNDIYPMDNIPNLISGTTASTTRAVFTYDETIDRARLTNSDDTYADLYSLIGKVANPVLSLVDEASGDERLKKQYKAEAYVLRAYAHYLLVNLYAKAYDPATAATDGGIYYQLEDADLSAPITQSTVQEVYDHILADVNAAIELNALPDRAENTMRVSQAFAYAVKAQVLMNMKKFTEAEAAALASVKANGYIEDYNAYRNGLWSHPKVGNNQDLFLIPVGVFLVGPSEDLMRCYEEGDILSTHVMLDEMVFGFHYSMLICGMDMGPAWFDQESYLNALGITTSQMYLTVAECALRRGDVNEAMKWVDEVRRNRIDDTVFQPLEGSVIGKAEALAALRRTLRTENFMSIWNYIDIKRWNVEPEYSQTVTRTVEAPMYGISETFTLSPSSNLWLRPFAVDALGLNSELKQNY